MRRRAAASRVLLFEFLGYNSWLVRTALRSLTAAPSIHMTHEFASELVRVGGMKARARRSRSDQGGSSGCQ